MEVIFLKISEEKSVKHVRGESALRTRVLIVQQYYIPNDEKDFQRF